MIEREYTMLCPFGGSGGGAAVRRNASGPIGEQMLITLMQAEAESFLALSGGQVWVDPVREIGAVA